MLWQDFIFTIGSLVFALALLPSVLGPHKPALASSVMTGSVLFIFAVTYITLGLIFSAISVCLTAIMWTILAIQKWRQSTSEVKC